MIGHVGCFLAVIGYSPEATTPGTGLHLARDTGHRIVQSTRLPPFFAASEAYRRGRTDASQ